MLDFSMKGVLKGLSNPQNICDGVVVGLYFMPTKPVAIATAAIFSGTAFYLIQPETLLVQISVVSISSGLGWAATEAAHQIGSKLFKNRLHALEAGSEEYEKTSEGIKEKYEMKESINKLLDDLFANSESLVLTEKSFLGKPA
ncbi:MAG: hypothetical protein H0W50_09550 [Parachlamydiaceae bacterium]|nr:hypothetical protein [Parachlamydiaceae bacterium]